MFSAFITWMQGGGFLRGEECQRLVQLAEATDEPWDEILYRLGILEEENLQRRLSEFLSIPRVAEPSCAKPPDGLNGRYLSERRMAWLDVDGEAVLGVVDPFDQVGLNGVRFVLGDVRKALISASQFANLSLSEGQYEESQLADPQDVDLDATRLADLASSAPIVRRVDHLIATGQKARASDIHLEPLASGYTIRQRVDGGLVAAGRVSRAEGLAVASRLKILAGLDIAERRRSQDGRLSYPIAGRNIDVRVSTVPTDFGESVVMRLLDPNRVALSFSALGFSPEQEAKVRGWINAPQGLVLITGPTGSGKTTTLYTMLSQLTDGTRKILTIEDPIEYRLKDVAQSQVDRVTGVTFASALRSFLRHDPDVMMVGEIRDEETASIAMQAAQTGHMVLSTLHTNDAPSAITRLRDLGVADYMIASTLTGVISQRLVGRVCSSCAGRGCDQCGGTGRFGRVAALECLTISDACRELIRSQARETELSASDHSFLPMRRDAGVKSDSGIAVKEDVVRIFRTGEGG